MSKIYYRVVEILDEHSILVNYGRESGANEDDEVRIISKGPEVIDPETNKSLGTLDSIKAVLTIVTAYDKFSLCKKIQVTTKNALISPLSQFDVTSKSIKTINVDKNSISNKELPNDKVIKVGDKVEIL
ncbi:hypothetical protein SAMN02745784_01833 [Tissierella praeacuta DSM 18095]|uniref:Uncharacterized protein n=1 Tax=Tissierella praeacuta DSM 18095 TaxID=1123404 RepID=A0A1M4WFA8_9FIRM|nr:hypothetical protein [Tissierella praeacuta]SHE79904.1 hypothetical protein SAMN02745784_01833 [Tissierella praeacuta DSM 18095]SUO99483.1 Uncharacterised protein [Tissierella praeacuta]